VNIAAPKRENADKESVMAGEAAKRLLPARGELMLGFMGQVKIVFNHQEYESSEEHISTRDAPSVERVPEESLFDAETKNLCFLVLFIRCQVGCVVVKLESS
jgi:hypothetical protein